MDKKGPLTGPEYDQRSKPARLPLSSTRDALLNSTAPESRGNQSSLGIPDRFAQRGVAEAGLLRKAHEGPVLEYPH